MFFEGPGDGCGFGPRICLKDGEGFGVMVQKQQLTSARFSRMSGDDWGVELLVLQIKVRPLTRPGYRTLIAVCRGFPGQPLHQCRTPDRRKSIRGVRLGQTSAGSEHTPSIMSVRNLSPPTASKYVMSKAEIAACDNVRCR